MEKNRKIIFHVDVNSAFLSWIALKRLEEDPAAVDLRLIPAVVGGDESRRHGIVLAKSEPAKKYGIATGEPIAQARRKCRNLVTAAPDFAYFAKKSGQLMSLLGKYAPEVRQFSIDEAFTDFTGTEKLYGDPVVFAGKLKDEIRDTLGFTVNVGVAHNMLLAKMASDFQKPDRVHTLFEEEIEEKMWPLPIGELFFVGKKTAQKLNSMGIFTIKDAAKSDQKILSERLGRMGETVWKFANGIDDGQILARHTPENKGYSNETTTGEDVTDEETARIILLSLVETVAMRIRADHAVISTVSVYFRDDRFANSSRQTTLKDPTDITDTIYETVLYLFHDLWKKQPLRLLGVSCSGAGEKETEQLSLFDDGRKEKLEMLNAALDSVRERYGYSSVKRASLLNKDKRKGE